MSDNVIVRVPEQQFIRGEDGYSPEVTIENIEHGHSVTITDRDHPTGQSFNVMDGDSAYEQAVAGGYTGTEAQFNDELASFKELSEQAADSANTAAWAAFRAQNYERHAGDAEDAARAYADIALTRMNSADESAQAAAGSAGDASTAATTATTKAGEATASATAADGSAKDAEAYAVGKRGGTDVGSTDPAYHNNAKYYAEHASDSATAASGSATSAASSATAAGNAQTAAETAQGKAEDAQEAAEAVLESIQADYTELSEDVDDLKSAVDDIDAEIYGTCALEWSDGLYGAGGYTSTAKWMYTNILQPGTYSIDTPNGVRYQVFKYISDTQGEAIEKNVREDKRYTVSEPIVISAGLISNTTLTGDDKNTIRNTFVVTDDNKSLVKSVERNEEEITSLRSDLTNSNLRYYGEETSTDQSAFIYFAGGNAIADGLMINRVNAKIIHPSGVTSDDTRGIGLSISGKDKNGNAVLLLSSRNIFPQDHSAAHKMTVVFDLFTMPYKVVGKVDYYVDNVYSRSYDVDLTSQVELDGIYAFGASFNTDSTTERTYTKTGVLYQGGTVIT